MTHEVDRAYYQRCGEKEREKARTAPDMAVRCTHERLAELYERKVEKILAHRATRPKDRRETL
ncbi:MAG TPA: hypothetical protein VF475_09010 [Sphingobium sp.]